MRGKLRNTAVENLDNDGDSNRVWDTIRDNIILSAKESTSLCEVKQWFDEECSESVD
jgi:hypothetical protein